MKKFVCFAAAAALVGLVHAASAQSQPSAAAIRKAAEEFSLGKQAYRDGNYLEAAEHFEAADDSAPSVNALRAAMTSRSKAGQLDRAATLAALAQERHPDDEKLTEEALEILQQADQELYRVMVSCDEPCSLVTGTSLVHGAPREERVLYLATGSHEIRASWAGDDATVSEVVEAEAGGLTNVAFLRPDPPAAEEPDNEEEDSTYDDFGDLNEDDADVDDEAERQRRGLPPGVFVTGLVATAGLGGVSIWSGIDTMNNPGKEAVQNDESCQVDRTECDLYKEGQKKELRTNILVGATAAVGVVTIIIGAVGTDWGGKGDSKERRRARRFRGVEPWVTVGEGAAFGARGRF